MVGKQRSFGLGLGAVCGVAFVIDMTVLFLKGIATCCSLFFMLDIGYQSKFSISSTAGRLGASFERSDLESFAEDFLPLP